MAYSSSKYLFDVRFCINKCSPVSLRSGGPYLSVFFLQSHYQNNDAVKFKVNKYDVVG